MYPHVNPQVQVDKALRLCEMANREKNIYKQSEILRSAYEAISEVSDLISDLFSDGLHINDQIYFHWKIAEKIIPITVDNDLVRSLAFPNIKKENRSALVVCCENTRNGGGIAHTKRDGVIFERMLKRFGFNVTKLIEPSRLEFEYGVRDYVLNTPFGATSVFLYSGHGVEYDGDVILGASSFASEDEGVPVSFINTNLGNMKNRVNISLINCCRSKARSKPHTFSDSLSYTEDKFEDSLTVYAAKNGNAAHSTSTDSFCTSLAKLFEENPDTDIAEWPALIQASSKPFLGSVSEVVSNIEDGTAFQFGWALESDVEDTTLSVPAAL